MEEKRTRIIRASASRFHSFFFHSTEIRDVSRYHHSRRFFVSLCDNAIRFHEKDLVQIQSPCTRYPPKIRCFARIRERKGQRCIIQRYTGRRKQDISLISILLRRYKSRGTRPRDSLRALVFLYFSFLFFPSFSPLSLSLFAVFSPFAHRNIPHCFQNFYADSTLTRAVHELFENRESIVSTLELTNGSRIAQTDVNTALNSFRNRFRDREV